MNILPRPAVFGVAPSVFSVFRDEAAFSLKIRKGLKSSGRDEDEIAPTPTITPVGAAFGDEFLTSEAHAAVTAPPAGNGNDQLINELHRL